MTIYELVERQRPFSVDMMVSPILAGRKAAFYFNKKLYISPAMAELLRDASSAEQVARAVRVVDLGSFDPFELPMTVEPPPPKWSYM